MAYGKTVSKKYGYVLVAVVSDFDADEVIAFAILDPSGHEVDRYYKLVTASHAFDALIRDRRDAKPLPTSSNTTFEP